MVRLIIETAVDDNNNFIPVSCAWQNDEKYQPYFVTDFSSFDHMFKRCFNDMLEQDGYTWYSHNLGSFDSVFMIKTLLNEYPNTAKFQFKDGKPLSIKISLPSKKKGDNGKKMVFKDSLKLLPMSLKSLIKEYRIKTQKLHFPYRFMTLDKLNYSGLVPNQSYYENISDDDYQSIVSNFQDSPWILRTELLKYMMNDVVALYQLLDIFSEELYDLENLNITDVSSISSAALKSYLSHYYNDIKTPIYIPRHNNYLELKNAYYGGRVEVFKGYAEQVFIYDVVSLYPSVMMKSIPTGELIKSTDTHLDSYYDFCYATVNVPLNIKAPVLPFRNESGGLIYPTGNWSGWFSSEILKQAHKTQNVVVEVHHGYKMASSNNLFNKFVDNFSKIKIDAEKENNQARRTIAKLLLNSLYGRFGLKYEPYTSTYIN